MAQQSTIRRLYRLLLPYRRTVALGMLCLLIAVAAELYPPLVWQNVVDHGLIKQDWRYIGWQLVTLIGVFGVGQLFSAIRGILLERAGQQLTLDLRLQLYAKLQAQSASYYANQRTGDLLARITADVESIQDVLVRGTDSVIANGLRLVGVVIIFISLQPKLGLIVLIPMLVVGFLLYRYNRIVRPVYQAARKHLGSMSAKFADNLGGIRVIQAFAQEPRETHELEALGRKLYVEQVNAVTLRNRVFPAIRWIANFGNVLMLAGGVYFILRGEFTLGGLLAYRGYGRYFYGPIDDLVSINDLLQRASASGQRIFEVLDAPVSISDQASAVNLPQPIEGTIQFKAVSFGYDPERPVLQNINLTIQAGERVALLGASGAGKSTLLALVARLYDPTAGAILIDNHDIREVRLASLRGQMAQVQQETYLFNTTVLENLRYGRPNATLEAVQSAARAANAHEFLSALPQGYDTLVGERGVKLSGGQRQRIAVARAILADPQILLLDEPTSAVEPESEAMIIDALERLMKGRTTLVVSHRLSLARSADRVVIIGDGRILEDGDPQILLNQPSYFAAMLSAEQELKI